MAESPGARARRLREALQQRGGKLPDPLRRLGDALGNDEDALSHEACLAALPTFVEAELEGQAVAELYPAVKHHLDRCDNCAAQYVDLLELALADVSDQLPQPGAVPAPDLSFLPEPSLSLRELVEHWDRQILTLRAPTQLLELRLIADTILDRLEDLGDGFVLRSGPGPALGLTEGQVTLALSTLAATYAATRRLVLTLTLQQLDDWTRQGRLQNELESRAVSSARAIGLDAPTAAEFARDLSSQIARDPAPLRVLIQERV